ncbi:hypothetical protein GQ53DRAFT_759622 [Thozetella sp. PMI_491]|nr:hypothetical protein GQ53DRAFT_759622 [Thozetella sp. PMI_491]
MCIKTIYYNTYGDGFQDMTERVETCVRGEMCRRPEIREVERSFRYNKKGSSSDGHDSSSLADGTPAMYHLRLPPTPRRSKSPSPHRRHKSSGVYINDQKVVDIPSGKKRHSHHPSRTDRDRVILHAPEPPAPARVTRPSTMPTEYVTVEPTLKHRGRDAEKSHRRRSSSRDGSDHQDGHRPSKYYRRHVRGGAEFVLIDDERERRRARRSSTVYDRSSDFSSSAADSEAVKAAGKKLRWKDEVEAEIALQNERISARPKLHQEVKGILKTSKGKDRDVYEDLRRAVEGLEIKDQMQEDEYEYDADRLRARFGGDRKRRSRVSYGAGLYNYQ